MLLKRRALNILTVEDPIEYEIPGVGQAEVDSADKVNFAKALRSLLRHDPDVIMIGEIRDAESLDTAMKASLTGHLVLSTLHTNDAVSAVTRLADMGLAPHLAAATLRLAAAQRLVRALCPHCRAGTTLERADAAALGDASLAGGVVYGPRGCLRCAGRGYCGRAGVFELFAPDAECAAAIAAGAHARDLFAMARMKGMRTLADDARAKCLAGVTTVAEAMRVVAQ
jgi:type IV pilus assembly protein PilB